MLTADYRRKERDRKRAIFLYTKLLLTSNRSLTHSWWYTIKTVKAIMDFILHLFIATNREGSESIGYTRNTGLGLILSRFPLYITGSSVQGTGMAYMPFCFYCWSVQLVEKLSWNIFAPANIILLKSKCFTGIGWRNLTEKFQNDSKSVWNIFFWFFSFHFVLTFLFHFDIL